MVLNFPDLKELWIEDNDNCELSKVFAIVKIFECLEKLGKVNL